MLKNKSNKEFKIAKSASILLKKVPDKDAKEFLKMYVESLNMLGLYFDVPKVLGYVKDLDKGFKNKRIFKIKTTEKGE
jgi:hypothetical protein